MALVFPRALPAFLKQETGKLELMTSTVATRSRGGSVYTKQPPGALPYWQFTLQSTAMTLAQSEQMQAWFDSLNGGEKGFLARDYKQPELLAYPNGVTALTRSGGGAFDATAVLGALTVNTLTVGAAGGLLPSGLQFKAGDKVGLVSSAATPARRMIYRVVEDVVASAGGVAVLNVMPKVYVNLFAPGDVVRVSKPEVECVLLPSGWSHTPSIDRATISITADSKKY